MVIDTLKILKYPHPALMRVAEPIGEISNDVRRVAEHMINLMTLHKGVGLAATQVGLNWRMFVANPLRIEGGSVVYINPTLHDFSVQTAKQVEGCLSQPGVSVKVERFKRCTVRAQDVYGQWFKVRGSVFESRVWQHEADHLNGTNISDRAGDVHRPKKKYKQRKRR
ncbi:MAG: peptide deformylase [SAR86 cluster bacterium]|uniref:Peptide deformylase n=1 Tax=SAR86 cluster bacterium TaxID=2030880 RepID=A0A2A5AHS4_9GAMM|nr:MAG: peptide deformylase [SAR86 cluster bacterium]